MKISYNWIQEYLDFPLPPVDELVKKIGAQLGEVETVVDLGAKYKNIIIVKIVSCQPVPDSDHLNVCLIDDGGIAKDVERDENGLVQVVCGAPNVRTGLIVAWLPPGSTVPSSFDKDPFVIGSRQLRGVMSNGMLASPHELAIGDSHDGILELDEQTAGTGFADAYKLDDHIIDIENKMFTHRPDCFGILGVAREIAGILGQAFREPSWFETFAKNLAPLGEPLPLVVRNEAPQLVPRFMALVLRDLHITSSSVQLQTYLSRVGIRPISNIVDATNYYMYLTGQPLHAYDYDKVRAIDNGDTATLVARQPREEEQLTLLNGKAITPRIGSVVIATESQLIGLGGVMGGANTEVDANTINIILESATFDMYSIRKTSMVHGLFSEAVTRFNKGQSPLQNDRILMAAARHICDTTQATFASDIIDEVAPGLQVNQVFSGLVTVTTEFISARLGHRFSIAAIVELLTNVGFKVEASSSEAPDQLTISVPFWRTDIALKEDIVEEVGRLYGFDKLPLELSARSLAPANKNPLLEFKGSIRSILRRAGANEILTYSFVNGKLLDAVGQNRDSAYKLKNALSPELQYYRLSITPSILEKVSANVRAGYAQFALFELGKAHQLHTDGGLTAEGVPLENERLSLVFVADAKQAKKYGGAPYYQARHFLATLLKQLGCDHAITLQPLDDTVANLQETAFYEKGRAAMVYVGDTAVGYMGEYRASVRRALKLPDFTAGFELDVTALRSVQNTSSSYQPLPKYPSLEQDICLRVPAKTLYAQVLKIAYEVLHITEYEALVTQVTPVDAYQRPDDADFKQITIRLTVASHERTLTETEVSKLMSAIAESAHARIQAERV